MEVNMKLELVTKLPGKIKIYRDLRNWVLEVGGVNNRFYFPELDQLCDELLNLRLKMTASDSRQIKTDLRSMIDAIESARESARRDIAQLQKVVTKCDRASFLTGNRRGVHG